MKQFKFIIALILYITVFSLLGESFQEYLSNFQYELYNTSMYLQQDQSQEQMIHDIENSAYRNGVDVFTIDYTVEAGKSKFIIYGTEGSIPYIEKNFGIQQKIYNSIFLGTSEIEFKSFEEITDISTVISYNIIGDEHEAVSFKRELINKYAGNFPKKPNNSIGYEIKILICWAILFLIILFLTYYDIMQQKKENFLRVAFGESILRVIIINIVKDVSLLIGAFYIAYFMLYKITYIDFNLKLTLICLVITITMNSIMYISLKNCSGLPSFFNI